jgi:hypothetical protein
MYVTAVSYIGVGQGKLIIIDVYDLPNQINKVGTLNSFAVSTCLFDFNIYSYIKISFPPLNH